MYSREAMLRAVAPYVIVAVLIGAAAGAAYGVGLIGVVGSYGVMLLAGLVGLVGYVRWDDRHHA
jgi:hypothetical protein